MCRRRRRYIDPLTCTSIVLAAIAVILVIGLVQSDTYPYFSQCTVHVKTEKALVGGLKKPSSKKLECEHRGDRRVIALKDDLVLPGAPERILTHKNVLACSFDVVTNPFNLLSEQIVVESLTCSPYNDIG